MPKSNRKSRFGKPHSDFPLTKHPRGYWCKRIKTVDGTWKMCYFGKIADDPEGKAALDEWLRDRDELLAGRVPRAKRDDLTVKTLVNEFLNWKRELVESDDLAQRSLEVYVETGRLLAEKLGKQRFVADLAPEDFQELRKSLAKGHGLVWLANTIQRIRSIFKFGYENRLLDRPVRFGSGFKKPSAKTMRKARLAKGPRMFEPAEVKAVLEHATPNIKAMVLLGINGALGNTDCAELPLEAVDLESGWLDYPRTKTAVNRRIPLWPETVEAIQAAIEDRAEPKDPNDAGLLFIGKRGQSYVVGRRGYRIHQELKRVRDKAGVSGRTFYDLRRTFETIGGDSRDQVAVDAIMGHAPKSGDMAAVYRQRISDGRLRAVVEYVRLWLFPPETDEGQDDQNNDERRDGDRPRLRVVG